jgi:hypothetical protein
MRCSTKPLFSKQNWISATLVAVVSQRIDFAVEVELNALLGFTGAKKPEGSGGEGENGGGTGGDLDPGFEGFEGEFEEHACLRLGRSMNRGKRTARV